jgi:anti-anti-sigma factor
MEEEAHHEQSMKIHLVGNLDASMSTYLSTTLEAAASKSLSLVTISLRHVRKTSWNAICMFAGAVRAAREKGMDIHLADARPHLILLLEVGGLSKLFL